MEYHWFEFTHPYAEGVRPDDLNTFNQFVRAGWRVHSWRLIGEDERTRLVLFERETKDGGG